MPHKSAEYKILEKLAIVQYATKYNFAPFVSPDASTTEAAVQYSSRLLKRLVKGKLVRPIPLYGGQKALRYNEFFCLTKEGHNAVETGRYKYVDPKSINNVQHESGKIDIALGFLYAFPDYHFEIDYNKILRTPKPYNPDIYIKMTNGQKTYEFLVEFERTRSIQTILDEKLKHSDKYDFQKNGISGAAKYLYFYTDEWWDVFVRPCEYKNYEYRLHVVEDKLKDLIRLARGLKHGFLFAPYHYFNRLNEPVFLDLLGAKRKLI